MAEWEESKSLVSWKDRLLSYLRKIWIRSSPEKLDECEKRILRGVQSHVDRRMVAIGNGHNMSMVVVHGAPGTECNIPLVLIHGFAGGAGIWCKNFNTLSKDRTVYAVDLIGFGRSSRPEFCMDASKVEKLLVSSLEAWRQTIGLEVFILGGHSLGGYVAAIYALQHPKHVEHLILIDCWGITEKPANSEDCRIRLPLWVTLPGRVVSPLTPLFILRLAGPLGKIVFTLLRPDLRRKYGDMYDDDTVLEYLYHCNLDNPSGEVGFMAMSQPWAFAKNPLMQQLVAMDINMPMTLLYGEYSWIDAATGFKLKELRPHSYVDVHLINDCAHHIYSDQSDEFNRIVNKVCQRVTEQLNGFYNSS